MRETVELERTWRVDSLGSSEQGKDFGDLDAAIAEVRRLLGTDVWAVQITPRERIVGRD